MKLRQLPRALAVLGLLASVVPITNSLPPFSSAHAAAGNITGTVFNDKNSNGVNDGSDVGVGSVTVSAYDSTGAAVGTTTTAVNGTYTLAVSGAATTSVRVEFTTPAGYQSSFQGSSSGTSIQFVSVPATNVNYSVLVPGEFCQNNIGTKIAAVCLRPGTTSLTTSKNLSTISSSAWKGTGPALLTKNADTGSLWGLAFDAQREVLFASAALRRHSGLGSKGIAGLYATSTTTGGVVASWDLSQAPFNLTFSANNATFSDANRGLDNTSILTADAVGYANVGKVGIGDIDMSPDGNWLFVSNLYEKKIHRIAVADSNSDGIPELGAVDDYAIPAGTCLNTTSRPWGLKYDSQDNSLLIGVVCSNESQSPALNAGAGTTSIPDPGKILKLALSAGTFSTLSTVDFDYVRSVEIEMSVGTNTPGQTCKTSDPAVSTPTGTACLRTRWHSWTDDYAAVEALAGASYGGEYVYNNPTDGQLTFVQRTWWPQPIIADIEVLSSGEIVLGVMDRFGMQMGTNNRKPTYDPATPNVNNGLVTGYVAGDTLLLCPSGGSYTQNNADGCSAAVADDAYMLTRAGLGGKRDYHEVFDDNFTGGIHLEMTIGGLAYKSSTKELAISMMDPSNTIFTGGIRYLNGDVSSPTFGQYLTGAIFNGSSDTASNQSWNSSFLKSTSMGDLELMCDSAPVQIGNRVWIDTNENGIQDPGEPPVQGAYVLLYAATGPTGYTNQVGTAITNANGEYYFSSNLNEGWWAGTDEFGGGLVAGQSYRIRMDVGSTFTGSGPLAGYVLTQATATSPSSTLDASIDNNATTVNGYPEITVPTVAAGTNIHSYDFGFHLIPAPTTTTSTTSSTTSTTIASSNSATTTTSTTTADSGSSTTSTPTTSTTVMGGTTSTSTTSSIAPAIVVPGGVSVGNYVWIDLNKDGIQDSTEPGITGVKLELRDIAGRMVTDLDGNVVGPTYTDGSGHYYFSNLPVGQYQVKITYPMGYSPTKAGEGTSSTDSSTDFALSKSLPTAGMRDYTLDFGVIVSAVIQEPIWIDSNGDGILNNGEKLVPGADVIILNEDGSPAKNLRGDSVAPVETQADGSFTFKDLAPGKYKVIVVYPEGYKSAITGATSETFTTEAVVPPSAVAQSKGTVTAVAKQAVARKTTGVVSVGNLVWFDANKDGFQGAGEKGVAGALLSIYKSDGSSRARDINGRLVAPQRTSASGRFLFTNLPSGTYVVKIVYPSGYRATVAKSIGRARNSSTDSSKSMNLAAGEADMTLDFGLVREPLRRLPGTL